jgi:hypothetical protein
MDEAELESLAALTGSDAGSVKVVDPNAVDEAKETEGDKDPNDANPDAGSLNPDNNKDGDKGDGNPPVDPPNPSPDAASPDAPSFEDMFKEKFGIDYNDELVDKVKAPNQSLEFADERIAKINELVSSGVKLENVIAAQGMNPESLSNEEAIRRQLEIEEPGITDAEIRTELAKYKSNDELEPEEVELKNRLLSRDGRKAIKFLEDMKAKNLLPEAPTEKPNNEEADKISSELEKYREAETSQNAFNESTKKLTTQWNDSITKDLTEYKSESFELEGDTSIEYEVSEEVSKKLEEAMQKNTALAHAFVTDDGKGVDMKAYRRAMLMAIDGKNIMKVFTDQVKKMGAREHVNGTLKDIDFESKGAPNSGASASKSPMAQMADKLEEV